MTAAHAARAYAAIQKAVDAGRPHADAKEQALIRAMARRYVEHFDPSARLQQDRAYADAMARVAAAYPDDLDVATLYAEALFLLLPRPRILRGRRPDGLARADDARRRRWSATSVILARATSTST